MARKPLNKEQRRYIRQNYKTLSEKEMAKQLKCDVSDIRDALLEMELVDEGPVHKALPLRKVHKEDILWGLPCLLIPIIVYTMTLCRTLYVGDSGEFSAQGSVLGIAHPPGYPMWVLMLKIAVVLFKPFFEHEAARGAFLCAIVAGSACFALYILIFKLSHYRTIAILGSLLFAFCYHFWSQALFSEVFILNVFFTVVTMLLMLVWSETQDRRYFLTLYLVTGLAMAHHNLFLVMPLLYSYFIVCSLFKKWSVGKEFVYLIIYGIAGLILYFIAEILANQVSWILIRQSLPLGDTFATKFMLVILTFVPYTLAFYWYHKRDKTVIYAILLFFLGFCMYLYLPMRLISDPLMSWGYPQTTEDLYNHISRRQYGPLSQIPRVFPAIFNYKFAIFGPWDIVKEQFGEYWIYFFRQFGSFWDHYSNPVFKHFNQQFRPPEGFPQGWKLGLMGIWTFSWVTLLLIGNWRLLRQNGKYYVLTLLAFLFYGPGMQAVLNFQTTNHSMYIIARFLIPSYLMASIWIAFGAQQILEWFKYGFQWKGLPPIPDIPSPETSTNKSETKNSTLITKNYPLGLGYAGCALIMAMPIIPLSMNYWHQDLSKNNVAYDFGRNILNSITPDGKLFIIGDNPTFAIAYLSYVENKFPWNQIYDEGENLFVMIHDFGREKFKIPAPEHNRLKDIGRARVTMTSETPVFYMSVQATEPPQEDPNRYQDYPGFRQVRQVPSGIVYQALRPNEPEPDYEATLNKMINLDPYFYNMGTDYYTRELVSNYHFLIGRAYHILSQDTSKPAEKRAEYRKKALEEFDKVSETGWDLDNMHINLANLYRMENLMDKSIEEFKKAIETQPRKALSYFSLGDLYRSLGDSSTAMIYMQKGTTLGIYDAEANNPVAFYLLGTMKLEQANNILKQRDKNTLPPKEKAEWNKTLDEAISNLLKCVSLDPSHLTAYQNLGEAYKWKGDYGNAVGMWERTLQMNPNFYPALLSLAIFYREIQPNPQLSQNYHQRYLQAMQAAGGVYQPTIPMPPQTTK